MLRCLKNLKKEIKKSILKEQKQAINTNAKIIAAGCPFCNTMLSDGIKSESENIDVKVMDISEIIDDSIAD